MNLPRIRIREKAIFSISAPVLIIFSVFTLFTYVNTSKALNEEIYRYGNAVTQTFCQMATPFIFESDYVSVLDNARQLIIDSDIVAIKIVGSDGRPWISTQTADNQIIPFDPIHKKVLQSGQPSYRKISRNSQPLLEFVSPVMALNKARYIICVEFSLKDIQKQISGIGKKMMLLSAGMILLVVVLVIALSHFITDPIKRLVTGTEEISQGNLGYRITLSSRDEIGDLAHSFNSMAEALKRELTERRLVEKELLQNRDRLEEQVADRTRELRTAVQDLKIEIAERKMAENKRAKLEARLQRARKMEAIGTLAGGVAHDLNNILSAIVTYPDFILLDLPENDPLRHPMKIIRDSGLKAGAIVQDMLTLARRGVTVTEVVNLNAIITEQIESPEFRRMLEENPTVNVISDLAANLMNIKGSAVHLAKTVMNLAANAAESMPAGGALRITTRNQHFDYPMNAFERIVSGDYVVITVEDSGTGIAPTHIERIFEPFYTTKTMGRSGTGLGMAVVWGTVKDHNGCIDIDSRPSVGTTFSLYFPVTRESVGARPKPPPIDTYRGNGETILVVDDVAEQREIATHILNKLGYRVTAVDCGEAAIEYLSGRSVDLLVLDMIMAPGIDGLETYRQITAFKPGQKAIIVSGFSENKRVREAQRLGAGSYVSKPYLLESLGMAVREELNRDRFKSPQNLCI